MSPAEPDRRQLQQDIAPGRQIEHLRAATRPCALLTLLLVSQWLLRKRRANMLSRQSISKHSRSQLHAAGLILT